MLMLYSLHFIDIVNNIFRGFKEDMCKDITFGACSPKKSTIIQNVTHVTSYSCQEACKILQGCKFYRYSDDSNSTCTFLREEYRNTCDIIGSTRVITLITNNLQLICHNHIAVSLFLGFKCRRMPEQLSWIMLFYNWRRLWLYKRKAYICICSWCRGMQTVVLDVELSRLRLL